MKNKYILLCLIILQLILFTIFCSNEEDTSGLVSYKINSRGEFSNRIGALQRIGFSEVGFGGQQLPTAVLPTGFRLGNYHHHIANSRVFNMKHETNYAVLPMLNPSYINEQSEVHISGLTNNRMNNEIYSNTNSHHNSSVFNLINNGLSMLFSENNSTKTPVISDETKSKNQYGFLALSTDNSFENIGLGESNIEERRFGNSDPGDNPEDPAIPVPEGFWVLLLFVVSYAGWINISKLKMKKLKLPNL